MTPRDFCYWLQGYIELGNAELIGIPPLQARIIGDHLKLVFSKETPDRPKSGAFLGDNREVFDDKYVKDALGIGDQKMQICGAKPWMHEPNNELETLGHPIPPKFDTSADYDITPFMSWNTNVPISC